MRWIWIVMALAVVPAGCSSPPGGPPATICDAGAYPCGPFGINPGEVIANLQATGRRDDNHDGQITDDPARTLRLSEYHANSRVKVLALFVTTEWCVPCQMEQPELIRIWNRMSPSGVAILEVLVQNRQGRPADQTTIDAWASRFAIPFDMGFDTQGDFGGFVSNQTYPAQLVITTSDMKVQWTQLGITAGALQTAIDATLAH